MLVISEAEVIDIVVNEAEAISIADVASTIIRETKAFANKWGAQIPYDLRRIEDDLCVFLTKHKLVNLTRLRVTILEGGDIQIGDTIRGSRRADLVFRIFYGSSGRVKRP